MKSTIKPLLAFAVLLAFGADGRAESRTINAQYNDPVAASARIKLRVIIPEILQVQLAGTTASGSTLALPASTGVPTEHLNSEHTVTTSRRETLSEILYTTASL